MPRGYERIDGVDQKDEHGVPLYPLLPADDGGVVVDASAAEPAVHVTVSTAGGAGGPGSAASAPLYYGESAGLYTPITHNEIIERHDQQPGMPVPQPLHQSQPRAPAPIVIGVSSGAAAGANTTATGGAGYPAQAYAQAYPVQAAPLSAAPLQAVAMPVPQMVAPAVPHGSSAPLPPMQPIGVVPGAGGGMHVVAMPMQQPPQQLVSVVPPVPQTLAQLRAVLENRYVAFDTGRYLREGWAFTRQNFCFFLGAIVGLGLLAVAAWLALYATFVAAKWEEPIVYYEADNNTGDNSGGGSGGGWHYTPGSAGGAGFQWATVVREVLYEVLVSTPLAAGCIATIFEAIRDNAYMRWRTLFSVYACPYALRLVGLSLVLSVVTRLLLLLFVVPGVWFAVVSAFAVPFHLQFAHVPLRAMHAIGLSVKTLHRNCCSFFGFVVACVLLNVLGALLLGVGLLVTVPVTAAATAYCYHHLVGINGAAVLVPLETAVAYQHQASAAAAAAASQTPVALPVPHGQQPPQQQPQVVVVVSPRNN